ncbi:hypothetical protein EVAR_25748_1 [Eumeta japonica]|uniref:Uncharacterized protein n=1 Tax=Eumeta variegata TaxID=151549 RepID=A0A4C1VA15_EUMVA|nr:hypothetical protein EVAR_25748_1 [Eumeta japonica]
MLWSTSLQHENGSVRPRVRAPVAYFPLHQPISPSIRYPIPSQEAGNAPVTALGKVDTVENRLYTDEPRTEIFQINATPRILHENLHGVRDRRYESLLSERARGRRAFSGGAPPSSNNNAGGLADVGHVVRHFQQENEYVRPQRKYSPPPMDTRNPIRFITVLSAF